MIGEEASWEPLDEVLADAHLLVRAARPVAKISDQLVALVDLRLARRARPE